MKWKSYSSAFVASRYNHLASIYPVFELIFLLPRNIRKKAVNALKLRNGDIVIEVGCGTGRNLSLLRNAVGDTGKVYGIDVSEKMIEKAQRLKKQNNWANVELILGDAENYIIKERLNGVLFSLSYAVMEHRNEILSAMWDKLKPGGHIMIMDSQFPKGILGKLMIPLKPFITLFLKATVLGNPYVDAVEELRELPGSIIEIEELSMKSYFIAIATKIRGITIK